MQRIAYLAKLVACAVVLVAATQTARAQIRVEATAGEPFGVARVTLPIAGDGSARVLDTNAFSIQEANGRVLYPAFRTGQILKILSQVTGGAPAQPQRVHVSFLFTGDKPLLVTVNTPQEHKIVVRPRRLARGRGQRLLRDWWRDYNSVAREQAKAGLYPPIAETYLTTMLATRLGLEPPLLTRIKEREQRTAAQKSLDVLMRTEDLRLTLMREMLRRDAAIPAAKLPPPKPIDWERPLAAAEAVRAQVEPLAGHVPEECFYIRFGKLANFIWLNKLLKEHGNEIGQLITLRGHEVHLNQRLQDQLGLKQSRLAEVFGGAAVADIALIGRDTFMAEGAAIGVLFQARNEKLLAADLERQRKEALAREKDAGGREEAIKIAGRAVSLIRSDDRSLWSYHAVDGDYHLVTTSKEIVRRFFEAGKGERALADLAEFRQARTLMPLDRDDTVFVYFSNRFIEGLASPQYQIELRRRLRALAAIELVQLARLAAAAEGKPNDSIEALVAADVLPRGFGKQVDGSGPVIRDGVVVDSLRGPRGFFTPIPDTPLMAVTRQEAEEYAGLVSFHAANWKRTDALLLALKRYELKGGKERRERIAIDARLSPFDPQKFGLFASRLGPPMRDRVAPVPGNIVSVSAVLRGGVLVPNNEIHHLFGGLRDQDPRVELIDGKLPSTLNLLRTAPAYLGMWPKMGILDLELLRRLGRDQGGGYTSYPFGLWRRSLNGYSVLSFDQQVLADVSPRLTVEKAPEPAQIRIDIGNLAESKVVPLVNALSYERARLVSVGNARFVHHLSQQFRLSRKQAFAAAERLLGAELACTLDGKYELATHESGFQEVVSSAWKVNSGPRGYNYPKEFTAPLLNWFRGAELGLTMNSDQVLARGHIDMHRKAPQGGIKLPSLNLFGKPKKDE